MVQELTSLMPHQMAQELRGERSGARYAVGTRVRVQVSRVDLDSRRIDFRLVRDGELGPPATRGRGERARAQSAVEELRAVKEADRGAKAAVRSRGGKAGKKTVAKPGAHERKAAPRKRR